MKERLAETLPAVAKTELSADCRDRLAIFVNFCKSQNVRHCPARPTTCAAFAAAEAANGRDAQGILSLLAAIEVYMTTRFLEPGRHGGRPPFSIGSLRQSLRDPGAQQKDSEWARLPPTIRETIARREKQKRHRAKAQTE